MAPDPYAIFGSIRNVCRAICIGQSKLKVNVKAIVQVHHSDPPIRSITAAVKCTVKASQGMPAEGGSHLCSMIFRTFCSLKSGCNQEINKQRTSVLESRQLQSIATGTGGSESSYFAIFTLFGQRCAKRLLESLADRMSPDNSPDNRGLLLLPWQDIAQQPQLDHSPPAGTD